MFRRSRYAYKIVQFIRFLLRRSSCTRIIMFILVALSPYFIISAGLLFIMFGIASCGQLWAYSYSYCIANIFCHYIDIVSYRLPLT